MSLTWVHALAVVTVAVPLHVCLGKVGPLVMRAVLFASRMTTATVIAFLIVIMAVEMT